MLQVQYIRSIRNANRALEFAAGFITNYCCIPLSADFRGKSFGLFQYCFDRISRKVRRIAVALKNSLLCNPHFCPDILPPPPICAGIASDGLYKFRSDDLKLFVGHDLHGAIIPGKGIILDSAVGSKQDLSKLLMLAR